MFGEFIAEQAAWGAQFRVRPGAHPEYAQLFERALARARATRDDETLLLIVEHAPPAVAEARSPATRARATVAATARAPSKAALADAASAPAPAPREAVASVAARKPSATAVAVSEAARTSQLAPASAAKSGAAARAPEAVAFLLAQVETRPAFFEETRRVRVDELFVRVAARRRGLGRALFARAQAWARAHGAARLVLQVARENANARAFYRALGFAPFMEMLEHEL